MSSPTRRRGEEQAPAPQTVLSHLEELRWRIVKSAAAIVAGSLIALLFADRIRQILQRPYEVACEGCDLIVLGPTEQFSVLMKVALFGGMVLASPVVLYQVWAFIDPALTPRERKWTIPIVGSCVLLFSLGVVFAYWTMPKALGFLLNIFTDVRSDLRLNDYFAFTTRYLLAFGASFLYPVFLFGAAAVGVISAPQLARGRRWAVLAIVVAAALITPSGDALTLALLSVPLYLFYEVTYWLVRLLLKR